MSEDLDLSGPDRIDDARFNAILWRMLKGDQPYPQPRSHASMHLLQLAR
jgi:hypothetical protein